MIAIVGEVERNIAVATDTYRSGFAQDSIAGVGPRHSEQAHCWRVVEGGLGSVEARSLEGVDSPVVAVAVGVNVAAARRETRARWLGDGREAWDMMDRQRLGRKHGAAGVEVIGVVDAVGTVVNEDRAAGLGDRDIDHHAEEVGKAWSRGEKALLCRQDA